MAVENSIAIKAWREARHLSGSELARRVGVTRQHLGRIERGECGASEDTLIGLAKALDVPIEAITYPEPARCAS